MKHCVECGNSISAPKRHKYCSDACHTAVRNRQPRLYHRTVGSCPWCGDAFTWSGGHPQTYCSTTCRGQAQRTVTSSVIPWAQCDQCSKWIVARRGQKRCVGACTQAAQREAARQDYHRAKAKQGNGRTPSNYRANVDRRSKRLTAAWVEDVAVDYLLERDNRRCHLCCKRVDERHKWPDLRSPSVDHLVPVSQGGEHSKANTALAHLGCNLSKHTRPAGEQLRLVG